MKRNMKAWLSDMMAAKEKTPLPILSFPTELISPSFQEFLFPLCRLLVSLPRPCLSRVSSRPPTLGSGASSKWLVLICLGTAISRPCPAWDCCLREKKGDGVWAGSGILLVTSLLTPTERSIPGPFKFSELAAGPRGRNRTSSAVV